MGAQSGAVSDRDQICKLGSCPNSGLAHGGPLDRAVATNFDIVFQNDDAMLRDFVMRTFVSGVSKAIIADDGAGMQRDTIAEGAPVIDHAVREEDAVIAHGGVRADPYAGIQLAALANACASLHYNEGVDHGSFADGSIGVHHGPLADALLAGIHGLGMLSRALKGDDGVPEGKVWLAAYQLVQAVGALHIRGGQNRSGPRCLQMSAVADIGEEGQFARFRQLQPRAAIDHNITVAAEFGAEVFGKCCQGHTHLILLLGGSQLRRVAFGAAPPQESTGQRFPPVGILTHPMGRLFPILVGLLTLASASIVAASSVPDADSLLDRPISAIHTKGLGRVSEQKVLNNIRSRVGQPYDPDTAKGDISRLTRLGDFSSIDIVAELRKDGTVDLTYKFKEERLLAAVSVVGNRVLSDTALLGPTGLHRGSARDDFLIERGVREMSELYRSKGYYLAEVKIDAAQLNDNDILIFEVIEGPRVRIRIIEFAGATQFTAKKLSSEIETTTWFPFFRRGEVDQDQLAGDIASLHKFYYDRGYIDIRVDKQIEVSPSQREAKVIFLIEEGQRYTVEELTAAGPGGVPLGVFSTEQLAAIMNIKVGDVFRQDLLDRSRTSIQDAYGVMGYLDTNVAIVPIRRGSTTELSLVVEVAEGAVADVGLVEITGNSLTKDKIIRTEVGFRPGRRFDAREIEATKERIMGTGLFGDALVTVQQPDEDDPSIRDVLVEIKEKNTGSINFGVGIGSDAGVLGNISLTQNNFDLFDVPETFAEFYRGRSFRGAGQRFAINFQPGTEIFAYDISLTEPRFLGTPYALGGSAGYYSRVYTGTAGGYTEERASAGAVLSRRLGDVWYGSLRVDASHVELTDLDPNEPLDIQNDAGPETLLSAGLTLTRTTIDRMSRPTKGSRTQLNIANWGLLGGDRNFDRISVDYTTYLALDRDFLGRVSTLRLDGQVGNIFGGSAPTYERFYLGGRTLRGFQFRSVSPKGVNPTTGQMTDVPIGGTFMAFLGAQYQQPLIGELLDGVLFVDSGTVNDDPGFDQYRMSFGVGIRVYIPQLGQTPLAFDLAFPMIKQEGDATQMFSFSADLPF